MKKYIIACDQGTTSSRAIIFDQHLNIVAQAQREFQQYYPKPGWVEHDPMDLWATQSSVLNEVIAKANIDPRDIDSIGITNQRETTIIWDKETGKPIMNAIVWQCRRTQNICDELIEAGHEEMIQKKTGLVIDAYFSGPKIRWMLDHIDGAQAAAEKGQLMFGTVDSWLLYKLSNQKLHVTDVTNASRTMLYNIHDLEWDEELLDILRIPKDMLPEVKNSSDDFGSVLIDGVSIPVRSIVGDQQAALFGQMCFRAGDVKNTYGTGGFLLMNTKDHCVNSKNGLISTIAVGIKGEIDYALEGSIFNAGSTMQWLRDDLELFEDVKDTSQLADSLDDNAGVYLVPAFTGLGAPYWDMDARATISGLTRGSSKEHIIRAGLESMAYQSHDILRAMESDSRIDIKEIKVDGGGSANDFLMQFQSDIMQNNVIRSKVLESSAMGAAALAGLSTGFFKSKQNLERTYHIDKIFSPRMEQEKVDQALKGWSLAVAKTKTANH